MMAAMVPALLDTARMPPLLVRVPTVVPEETVIVPTDEPALIRQSPLRHGGQEAARAACGAVVAKAALSANVSVFNFELNRIFLMEILF
jgi:hypothetical protein